VTGDVTPFQADYAAALTLHLAARSETTLTAGYQLGREAVDRHITVLDIALIHHQSLAAALARDETAAHGARTIAAAGEFLVEALAAVEMVRRGYIEATERASVEARHAAMIRQLSTFLADSALAADAPHSLEEVLRLVAEQARELTSADWSVVTLHPGPSHPGLEAVSPSAGAPPPLPSRQEVERMLADAPAARGRPLHDSAARREAFPPLPSSSVRTWLGARLTFLDGRRVGLIELLGGGGFTDVDEAVVVHLSQMASAAIERTQHYRGPRRSER
jgi:hypothetical protein